MELYLKSREEWHEWLEDNHAVIPGIWLVYPQTRQQVVEVEWGRAEVAIRR